MINPNDPKIQTGNPQKNTPKQEKKPLAGGQKTSTQNTHQTLGPVITPPSPVEKKSEKIFDLDQAIASLEEPTPTPEPTIKTNPRNIKAVIENHHEDIANGTHESNAPIAPTVASAIQSPESSNAPQVTLPTITPKPPQKNILKPGEKTLPTHQEVKPAPATTPNIMPTSTPAQKTITQAFTKPTAPVAPNEPATPTTPKTPTKNNIIKTKKKGMRIGFKGFAIGCVIFLLLIAGGGVFILLSMFQNPGEQTRNIIDRQSAEILLKVFTGTIAISLTLFGTIFTFVNIFRLASKKNTKKGSYVMGIIMGIILLTIGLAGGIRSIGKLNSISNTEDRSGQLVTPYIALGNNQGLQRYGTPNGPKAIAPSKIVYKLDMIEYKNIIRKLGVQKAKIELSCGNGTSFPIQTGSDNKPYFGPCFYTKKGNYPITVTFTYIERTTGEQATKKIPIGGETGLTISSSIELKNISGTKETPLETNSTNTEIIAGTAPAKVSFNAQKLISELGLKTNNISWDLDGDGTFEHTEKVIFSHNFLKSQLHTIAYKIGNEEHVYQIPLRVEQSSVPICQVVTEEAGSMSYRFDVSFIESNATIGQYLFEIVDRTNNTQIDRIQNTTNTIDYDFTKEGSYAVTAYFITSEGGKGKCQSPDFRVGGIPYTVDHNIAVQGPQEEQPTKINQSTIMSGSNNTRTMKSIPSRTIISIKDIRPRNQNIRPIVLLDGKQSVSADNKTFITNITTSGTHTIQIGVQDNTTNQTTIIKTYTITVDLPVGTGTLGINPDNVGYEPFVATLDASTITLNDPDDEIIYFSRDFGDGEVKKNQNQGKIKHTYYFDTEKQQGVYYPQVTITTRKGQTTTIKTTNPITIKRALRKASITFDSHPAQIAPTNENIKMSLTVDNIPKKIVRDFGDGETFECNGRSCSEIEHSYSNPGTYNVSTTISYKDYADIKATTKIIIQ